MELPYRPSTTTTIRDRSWWRTFTRDSVRCSGALKAEQTATLPVKNDPLAQTDNLPALGKIDGDQVGGNPTNRCRESRATASTLTHSLRFRRRPRCGLHPDLQLEGPRTLGVTRELKRKKGMHGARSPSKGNGCMLADTYIFGRRRRGICPRPRQRRRRESLSFGIVESSESRRGDPLF